MKKFVLFISLLTFMVMLVGCWDYTEYEQMTQIYSLGVDLNKKSNEVTITLQFIPITKATAEKTSDINRGTVFSASALTITDALIKLQQASSNKLFFGYLQVILIGEDAATYIMKDIIEHIERTPILRSSVNIIVVSGKAEGTIATRDPNSVTSSGKKIRMLLSSAKSNGSTYGVTLHDFLQKMVNSGVEPIAPRIITTSLVNDRGEALGGSQKGVRFAVEKQGNLLASGMAVFKTNKFVGWLDDKETLGMNWILGNKVSTYKTSDMDEKCSNENKEKLPLYGDFKKMLYFYITRSGSKIKVKIEHNSPVVYLNVKVEATVRKYYSDKGDEYITPDIVDSIEQKLKDSINSDIMAALSKGKDKLDSDIFGFGYSFYREHPREWHKDYEKSWNEIFQSVPVRVKVEAKVNNTGTNIKKLITK